MKEYYLKKAEENLPKINITKICPDLDPVILNSGDTFVVDLGTHYVGYFSW